MKSIHKILTILMVLIASMTLVACSTTDEEPSSEPTEQQDFDQKADEFEEDFKEQHM